MSRHFCQKASLYTLDFCLLAVNSLLGSCLFVIKYLVALFSSIRIPESTDRNDEWEGDPFADYHRMEREFREQDIRDGVVVPVIDPPHPTPQADKQRGRSAWTTTEAKATATEPTRQGPHRGLVQTRGLWQPTREDTDA